MHTDAPTAAATDWAQILALYDQLAALAPTPVVALNRAVALAEVEGRLGRPDEAAVAYADALELVTNATERRFLEQRRRMLPRPCPQHNWRQLSEP